MKEFKEVDFCNFGTVKQNKSTTTKTPTLHDCSQGMAQIFLFPFVDYPKTVILLAIPSKLSFLYTGFIN